MEFEPATTPGREALYLKAGTNTGANPTPGDIGPTPPDPTDPQYRMGIGLRILGMANNFLQGMAHRPPGGQHGAGAPNGQYNQDLDAYHRDTQGKVTRTPSVGPTGVLTLASGDKSGGSDKPLEAEQSDHRGFAQK